MVGTLTVIVVALLICHKSLTSFAVPTSIFIFVNMIRKFSPYFLTATFMIWIGRANEVCILYPKRMNEILEFLRILINKFLHSNTLIGSFLKVLIAVFISTSLQANLLAVIHHIPTECIRKKIVHSMAKVRITVDVWNSCSDI